MLMEPAPSPLPLIRPMPRAQRRTLVDQYRGRRKLLAEAAHVYLTYYENSEHYAIDWSRSTVAEARRTAEGPYYGEWATVPQCLCEEDFLGEVLWAFMSNTPLPLPP